MTETIVEALEKLRAVAAYNDPKLDFVKAHVYDLGINDLVKYGADQYVVRLEIPCFRCLPCFPGQVPHFGRGNFQALPEFGFQQR